MIKQFFQRIKENIKIQQQTLKEAGKDYIHHNMVVLKIVCWLMVAIIAILRIISIFFWKEKVNNLFTALYISVFVFFIVYLIIVYVLDYKRVITPRKSLVLTIVCDAILFAYILIVSVFPNPTRPSAYFALYLAVNAFLFFIPFIDSFIINTVYTAAFFVLIYFFKDPSIFLHEYYETAIAYIISIAVSIVMLTRRYQSMILTLKYKNISERDGLSGAYTRTTGISMVIRYLRTEMNVNSQAAIIILDIDNFKKINDTYGHIEGDFWIKEVIRILSENVRPNDVIARYGGDEFMILAKDYTKEDLENLFKKFAQELKDDANNCNKDISVSFGACLFKKNDCRSDELFIKADTALYDVKNSGKNSYKICELDENK